MLMAEEGVRKESQFSEYVLKTVGGRSSQFTWRTWMAIPALPLITQMILGIILHSELSLLLSTPNIQDMKYVCTLRHSYVLRH